MFRLRIWVDYKSIFLPARYFKPPPFQLHTIRHENFKMRASKTRRSEKMFLRMFTNFFVAPSNACPRLLICSCFHWYRNEAKRELQCKFLHDSEKYCSLIATSFSQSLCIKIIYSPWADINCDFHVHCFIKFWHLFGKFSPPTHIEGKVHLKVNQQLARLLSNTFDT